MFLFTLHDIVMLHINYISTIKQKSEKLAMKKAKNGRKYISQNTSHKKDAKESAYSLKF